MTLLAENSKKISINLISTVIAIMTLLTALTGFFNQSLLSMAIVACCIVLFFKKKLILAFPFMIFYNSFYGLVFGFSVFRIYSLLVLADFIIKLSGKIRIRTKYLPPLVVYIVYLIMVMMPVNISTGAFIIIDVLCCFILVSQLVDSDDDIMKKFFKVYVVVCLCSFLSGMRVGNYIGDEYSFYRFMATFEDPNYMGFFYTLAIFSTIMLKLFTPKIRFLVVITLYAMVFYTLSISAIVVNCVLWVFYLIVMKKLRFSHIFVIGAIGFVVVYLYNYALDNPDAQVIGPLATRISSKIDDLLTGDLGDVTTGRSTFAKEHLDYFIASPLIKMLFGGTAVNARYIQPGIGMAAHNEYVDMLLNVGIIGAVIMFGYFFKNFISYFKEYKRTKDGKYMFLVMSKVLWMSYAMTLTMFIDYRFMFIFLI